MVISRLGTNEEYNLALYGQLNMYLFIPTHLSHSLVGMEEVSCRRKSGERYQGLAATDEQLGAVLTSSRWGGGVWRSWCT